MEWQTKSVTLDYPVTTEAGTTDKVEFRAPNGRMLRQIDALELPEDQTAAISIPQMLDLIRIIGGLSEDVVDELHQTDIAKLGENVSDFLAEILPTSANSDDGGSTTPKT